MVHGPKYLMGLTALASALLCGSALAVPIPTYPRFDPRADEVVVKAPSPTLAMAPGARILYRTSTPSSGTLRSGGAGFSMGSATINTTNSRSKVRYLLPGMILAAMTPFALHHHGDAGDQSVAVQTRAPQSSASLTDLALLGGGGNGHGHGRGGNGDNGNNGNNGGDDGEDCDNGDNSGGGDNGEVCDSGDNGGDTGDDGSGDCDNGGNESGGGGDHGGGGGNALPEPGTVPLVGAGLMVALAFRSRRAN